MDCPGNGDGLALAARERAHRFLELGEVRIEARHHNAGLGFHGDIVERAPGGAQLAPEEQVGRGVEVLGQRQGLIDRLDTVAPGVARAVDRHRSALDADLSRIRSIGSRQHLDQGRFAGAVVAEQADDLTALQVERHVVYCLYTAEADAHAAQLDQRRPRGAPKGAHCVAHAALPFRARER